MKLPSSIHFKNIMLGIAGVIASICIPIMTLYFAELDKNRDLDKSYVEIGANILSQHPTEENEPLREWAIDVIDNHSDVKFSPRVRYLLLHKYQLPAAPGSEPARVPVAEAPQATLDALRASGFTLGIILSQRDRKVQFDKLADAHITFAYIKASQGGHINPATAGFVADAEAQKIKIGLFHMFDSRGGSQQVQVFLAALHARSSDLPPLLDVEDVGSKRLASKDEILLFLKTVEDAVHITPVLYVPYGQVSLFKFDARFARYPLFLAHYTHGGTAPPRPPKPWTKVSFWDYADSAHNAALADIEQAAFLGDPKSLAARVTP